MTILYGIPNCDTVKKARRWLEENKIDYQFHDFRKEGLEPSLLESWLTELGWETLINKRSTSWKALDENTRNQLDNATAKQYILEAPTLIKRPVLVHGNRINLGFKDAIYHDIF